jgi:BASS family bile acid:Na+ symporter
MGDDVLVRVVIPVVVVFCMTVVGLDLTLEDFRRVARHPRLVGVGVLGPVLGLPPLAVALGHALALPPAVAEGMVLVAACPTAILSNLYTALARGTVALSVTVTAVSSVGSVVTLPPILLLGLGRAVGGEARVAVPVGPMMGQLVAFLLVPAILGMVVRAAWPVPARRWAAPLRATSLATVLAVVAAIVAGQVDRFVAVAGAVVVGATAFAVVAMTAGWLTAAVVGGDPGDRFALAMAWSARNLGIATLVGATILGRAEWLVFTAAFFAAQAVLATAAVVGARVIAPARRGAPAA